MKNIQRLAKIESRDAAARDFSVAPSCVWWQVVEDLFAGGLYVVLMGSELTNGGWKQMFGFMFISEEIG